MAVPLWPQPETEVGREEPEMAWSTDALMEWLSPSGKGDWFRRIVSSINTLAWATLFGTVPVIWTNRSKEPGRTEKWKMKLKSKTEKPSAIVY